jgi:hypothetical protein
MRGQDATDMMSERVLMSECEALLSNVCRGALSTTAVTASVRCGTDRAASTLLQL